MAYTDYCGSNRSGLHNVTIVNILAAAVRLQFRLRFEHNVTLLTYKLLRLLCGLKII